MSISREWHSPWEARSRIDDVGAPLDVSEVGGTASGTTLGVSQTMANSGSQVSLVRVRVDGGSRGNPGPSAIGVVLEDAQGRVLETVSRTIGETTNNVAEYRALLTGLELAKAVGARQIEVLSDSELLVRQMSGQYRVKNEGLKPLYAEAKARADAFDRVTITHVSRENNAEADGLVNQALDGAAPG